MLREKAKARSTLVTVAAVGLLLAHLADFLTLTKYQSSSFGLIGNLLFFGTFLAVIPAGNQGSEVGPPEAGRKTMIWCIATSVLLFTNGFVLNPHWLHGALGIAAYWMMIFCWSLPDSRWTAITFLPIYGIALLRIKWRLFPDLLKFPIWIWALICVTWIMLSLVAFRLIDKREHARLGVELN